LEDLSDSGYEPNGRLHGDRQVAGDTELLQPLPFREPDRIVCVFDGLHGAGPSLREPSWLLATPQLGAGSSARRSRVVVRRKVLAEHHTVRHATRVGSSALRPERCERGSPLVRIAGASIDSRWGIDCAPPTL
jgi:hypothetical protein